MSARHDDVARAIENAAPPAPPRVLQSIMVTGASLRRLMRTAGLRTTDPTVAIVGVGSAFPAVSGLDWSAACDPLPAGMDDLQQLPDISDFVAALMSVSDFLLVDGDADSAEALHGL